MRTLITGGCGFLGTNLASEFLKSGNEVFIIDGLFRKGSQSNLNWLNKKDVKKKLKFFNLDIKNNQELESIFVMSLAKSQ